MIAFPCPLFTKAKIAFWNLEGLNPLPFLFLLLFLGAAFVRVARFTMRRPFLSRFQSELVNLPSSDGKRLTFP
jgi:hypothetical protein